VGLIFLALLFIDQDDVSRCVRFVLLFTIILPQNIPEPDELNADIEELGNWVKSIQNRRQ